MSIPRLFKVEAAFGSTATNPYPRWTDITSHVMSLSTRRGRSYELDRIEAGQANIVLDNADGWFTPGRSIGPYAGQLAVRLPVRAYTVLDDNWVHHDCVNADGVDFTTVRWNTRYRFNTSDVDMFIVAARVNDPLLARAVFELSESHNGEPDIVHMAGLFGDSDVIHVNAGETITVDVDLRPTTSDAQAGAALFFTPYSDQDDEQYVQGNLATSATAWTHSTLIYAAPADGYVRVGVYSVSGSSKVRVANMKLRRNGVGTATAVGISGIFPIFRGFVERYTTRAGFKPTTELSCVDALSILSRPLETYHRDLVRRFTRDPWNAPHIASMHYWPCVESAESATAVPTLGSIPLVLRYNITGNTDERPAFTSTKTMEHADGMNSGGFTNTGPDPSHGGILSVNHNGSPALPRGRSVGVSFWYRGAIPPVGQIWQLFAALNTSGGIIFSIELDSDADIRFFYSGNGITNDTSRYAGRITPDTPTHIGAVINVEPDNTTEVIGFVDGAYGLTPQPVANPLPPIAYTQLGGILVPGRAERFTKGTLNHLIWITSNQVSPVPPPWELLFQAADWGVSTPVYEARPAPRDHTTKPGLLDLNLDAVGWAGSRMLDPGLTMLLSPRWDQGAIAFEVIGDAASSASGLFFAGPAGEMIYHNRTRRADAPERWHTSEWTDQLAFDLDDQKVYNQITVQRSTGMIRTARDETSIAALGVKALKVTCDADNPDELAAAAGRLLHRYRRAVPRCHTLTIDATALSTPEDDQLIGLAHGAEISDRLNVENLPVTAPADTLDLFIEGVAHDITPDGQVLRWRTTLQVSDASAWQQ